MCISGWKEKNWWSCLRVTYLPNKWLTKKKKPEVSETTSGK